MPRLAMFTSEFCHSSSRVQRSLCCRKYLMQTHNAIPKAVPAPQAFLLCREGTACMRHRLFAKGREPQQLAQRPQQSMRGRHGRRSRAAAAAAAVVCAVLLLSGAPVQAQSGSPGSSPGDSSAAPSASQSPSVAPSPTGQPTAAPAGSSTPVGSPADAAIPVGLPAASPTAVPSPAAAPEPTANPTRTANPSSGAGDGNSGSSSGAVPAAAACFPATAMCGSVQPQPALDVGRQERLGFALSMLSACLEHASSMPRACHFAVSTGPKLAETQFCADTHPSSNVLCLLTLQEGRRHHRRRHPPSARRVALPASPRLPGCRRRRRQPP